MKNYLKPCKYSIKLVEKLNSLDLKNDLDFKLVDKAIYWAKKYHNGQFRKSGEPFYSHPLEVAYMISDHLLHTNTIVASILHDIVEDTEVTIGMILDEFGWRIAEIVDGLTRDRPDGTKLSVEEILNNAYEQNDKEVLLIKCFDRLHNMETLSVKSKDKQIKESHETFDFFITYAISIESKYLEQVLYDVCCKYLSIPISHNQLNAFNKDESHLTSLENYDTHQIVSQVFQSVIDQSKNIG